MNKYNHSVLPCQAKVTRNNSSISFTENIWDSCLGTLCRRDQRMCFPCPPAP